MIIESPMSNPVPKEISQTEDEVTIIWNDGHISKYLNCYLRQKCPCALCTEDQNRKSKKVSPTLSIMKIDQIGRYAFKFQFSDLHQIGIYTFPYLRSLCMCGECESL